MKQNKAFTLLKKFISGKASDEEATRVNKWYDKTDKKITKEPIEINDPEKTGEEIFVRIQTALKN